MDILLFIVGTLLIGQVKNWILNSVFIITMKLQVTVYTVSKPLTQFALTICMTQQNRLEKMTSFSSRTWVTPHEYIIKNCFQVLI